MTSGLWIDNVGFIPSAWFILSCFIFAGVWTLFCVPETPRSTNGVVPRFFSLENIKSFLTFFRKERESGRRNLFLPLTCAGVVYLVTIGVDGVLTLFLLKSPLCWGPHSSRVLFCVCNVRSRCRKRHWCERLWQMLQRVDRFTDWHGDFDIEFHSSGLF